jgi:hypothetical protein
MSPAVTACQWQGTIDVTCVRYARRASRWSILTTGQSPCGPSPSARAAEPVMLGSCPRSASGRAARYDAPLCRNACDRACARRCARDSGGPPPPVLRAVIAVSSRLTLRPNSSGAVAPPMPSDSVLRPVCRLFRGGAPPVRRRRARTYKRCLCGRITRARMAAGVSAGAIARGAARDATATAPLGSGVVCNGSPDAGHDRTSGNTETRPAAIGL